jgi:hypothetical protein
MTTYNPANNDQVSMLERYLSEGKGQLDVQGRLILGVPAPSEAQRAAEMSQIIAKMSEKLGDLGRGPVTDDSKHHKMTQELNNLPRRG